MVMAIYVDLIMMFKEVLIKRRNTGNIAPEKI